MSRSAGDFDAWLAQMQRVLRGEDEADVPCDGCVGCCVSAYPIPLRPTDAVALERVPDRYLEWPRAGGLARMQFREDGSCPMLLDRRCTIYAARPRTCRDYDCRIYAAAGLMPDGERPVIQGRVAEWEFSFGTEAARKRAGCVRRAAQFIRGHAAAFPASLRAHSATAAAVMAVQVHHLFAADGDALPAVEAPETAEASKTEEATAVGIERRVRDIEEALRGSQ